MRARPCRGGGNEKTYSLDPTKSYHVMAGIDGAAIRD